MVKKSFAMLWNNAPVIPPKNRDGARVPVDEMMTMSKLDQSSVD